MQSCFPNRKSTRLKNYDYSKSGGYYLTICTKNKIDCLSKVIDNKIFLSEPGVIIEDILNDVSNNFPNVSVDCFVIMPNHIHLILIVSNCQYDNPITLGEIVRFIKAKSAKIIRDRGYENFRWQRNYFDRIIRNEKELWKFRRYINENSLRFNNWNAN